MSTKKFVQLGKSAFVDIEEVTGACVVSDSYRNIVKVTTKGGNTIVIDCAGSFTAQATFDEIKSRMVSAGVVISG